ncbi:MAG: 3-deoxy-manno-octulosonate cytidylyltransferase [Acidiferrobacteraceae bacterium]
MKIIIPARYTSSRLPGKVLLDVAGKTLLERVYACAARSGAGDIVIATDDTRVSDAAEGFGAVVCRTSARHTSGTERIAEAIEHLNIPDDEIVINLQGDEPLMPPPLIAKVAQALAADAEAVAATAATRIADRESFLDPDVVKVVCDRRGRALYFSRAPIPWPARHRPAAAEPGTGPAPGALRHIGLYAYRAGFIRRYAGWDPSPIERIEVLEQLRVLWYGAPMVVFETDTPPPPGVDTPDDLERVRRHFESIERKQP